MQTYQVVTNIANTFAQHGAGDILSTINHYLLTGLTLFPKDEYRNVLLSA